MNPRDIMLIVLSVYTYFFMEDVKKKAKGNSPLTRNEKIQVVLLLIFNTLLSWIILSFGWKKELPAKSKQVNKYGLVIVGVLVGLAVLGLVVAVILVAINPARQMHLR